MEETVKKIPPSSKKRFPLYLRALSQLHQRGVVRVMSYQIGNICNISADTVRRDLMYVKHQGKTASGYEVENLLEAFNEELGTSSKNVKIILIGVGNIGQGLLKYNYLPSHVGKIECAYDVDPSKIKLANIAARSKTAFYSAHTMASHTQWCVAAYPNKVWAKKVFPNLSQGKANEELWNYICKSVRLDAENPVLEWEKHQTKIHNRCQILNDAKIKSFTYKNSKGTNLTVGMPKDYIFCGGSEEGVLDGIPLNVQRQSLPGEGNTLNHL